MCVILGSSRSPFRQLWMQDIVFLTPGGAKSEADIGQRHVITTLALECGTKTDISLTYASQIKKFEDMSETLPTEEGVDSHWINAATNHGGATRLRHLWHDSSTDDIWLQIYRERDYTTLGEFRSLKPVEAKLGKTWPDDYPSEKRIIDPLEEIGIDPPFQSLTLKDVPAGKSILRFSITIENTPEQVGVDSTSFDLLGPRELRQRIVGSLDRIKSLRIEGNPSATEIHGSYLEIFRKRLAYGPSGEGVYDCIIKSYPGCTIEPLMKSEGSPVAIGPIRLPWANPAVSTPTGYLGTLYTALGDEFRLQMNVHVPLGCEFWQYPREPYCTQTDTNPRSKGILKT